LNQQILQLQQFTKNTLNAASGSGAKQVSEHNNNVVMMLQSKLADTSIGFKDVLEIRTQVSRDDRCGGTLEAERRADCSSADAGRT
jgi:syntaxin 5